MSPKNRFFARLVAALVALGLLGVAGLFLSGARMGWTTWRRAPSPSWADIQRLAAGRRWDELERDLNRWREAHPEDGQGLVLLAQVQLAKGRKEEAAGLLEKVPEGSDSWVPSRTALGELAIQDRRAADAERYFRAAADRDPGSLPPRQRLIYLLSLQQRPAEAREFLWEIKRIQKDPRVLVDLLIDLLQEQQDVRSLPPELEEFQKKTPNDPFLHRAWGMSLLYAGKAAEALPYLEAAAERIGNDPGGRFALAECRLLLGKEVDPELIFGVKPEDPGDAAGWWIYRGRLEESLDRSIEAAASYKKALEIVPLSREAHYRLGHVLKRVGTKDEAAAHLAKATALADRFATVRREHRNVRRAGLPRDAALYEHLGSICLDAGLIREARAWFEEAVALDPSRVRSKQELTRLAGVADTLPLALPRPALVKPGSAPGMARLESTERTAGVGTPTQFVLEDVASSAGVSYQYDSGASERLFIAETMGGGVGLLDFDGDGWLDIYFVNGCPLPFDPAKPPAPNRLFRNRKDGTFQEVTAEAGVSGQGYGMGCVVGDYDNDGHDDLFVTGLDRTILYRNLGNGRFEDVTRLARVFSDRWTTASGFGDLDGDGDLDLVVITYLQADPKEPTPCRDAAGHLIHCTPARFPDQLDLLFRNNGDGTFTDLSHAAGFDVPGGRGLGLAIADFDDDGKLDIFVANDSSPDFLFRNLGGFRFEEVGALAGVATNGLGRSTASMGVVADDLDGDGRIDLFITNMMNESSTFFRNLGHWLFQDATLGAGLDAPSRGKTGFGDAAIDVDNDGRLDLFVATGDVDHRPWVNSPMAQTALLFRGQSTGRFKLESSRPGLDYFARTWVGRGAAMGDLDNDGRPDLVVVHRDAPVALLANRTQGGHWLGLRLVGTRSGKTPVGARVTCRVGGRSIRRWLTSGTGYLSAHDPRLWFGLDKAMEVDSLEVKWPSGAVQKWTGVAADRILLIEEGRNRLGEPAYASKGGPGPVSGNPPR